MSAYALSLLILCSLMICRMVPLRLRMNRECVDAPPPQPGGVGGPPAGAVTDALHELAVGDAGGHEEAVVTGDEVVGVEHPVEVVAGVDRALPLRVAPGPPPAPDRALHALHRARRDDALGRPADAEEEVDAGV